VPLPVGVQQCLPQRLPPLPPLPVWMRAQAAVNACGGSWCSLCWCVSSLLCHLHPTQSGWCPCMRHLLPAPTPEPAKKTHTHTQTKTNKTDPHQLTSHPHCVCLRVCSTGCVRCAVRRILGHRCLPPLLGHCRVRRRSRTAAGSTGCVVWGRGQHTHSSSLLPFLLRFHHPPLPSRGWPGCVVHRPILAPRCFNR